MPRDTLPKDAVVTAWLTAEIASPRFGDQLRGDLSHTQAMAIIKDGTATQREDLLIQARHKLLHDFPWEEVVWSEYLIKDQDELGAMRTGQGNWLAFSSGTRLLSDAAQWVASQPLQLDPHRHVNSTMQSLQEKASLPPIIAFLPNPQSPAPVIWEGHVRAVSYYLYPGTRYPLSIFLGRALSTALYNYDNGLNLQEIKQAFLQEEQ